MRLLFFGNQDNNAYRLARWCRAMGTDVDLYLIRRFSETRSLPEQVDPELYENYPDWIHSYEPPKGDWWFVDEEYFEALQGRYDVVVTSGTSGALASNAFKKIPVLHMALGGDVAVAPWQFMTRGKEVGLRKRQRSLYHLTGLVNSYATFNSYVPCSQSLFGFGLESRLRLIETCEDIVGNIERLDRDFQIELQQKYGDLDRLFVWPSRLNFLEPGTNYKAPEVFARALKDFLKQTKISVRTVLIDHGADAEEFKNLLYDLGLAEQVDFLSHLPYNRLLSLLSLENAIAFDCMDGKKGEIGGATREAFSLGTPSIRTFDFELIENGLGPGCPGNHAGNQAECLDQMIRLSSMENAEFQSLREKTRSWALEYMNGEVFAEKVVKLAKEAKFYFRDRKENESYGNWKAVKKRVKLIAEMAETRFGEGQKVDSKELLDLLGGIGVNPERTHYHWKHAPPENTRL